MKLLSTIAFAFSILCSSPALAKDIGMDISFAQFMNDEGQGYLEIYFALDGNSIDFKKTANNQFKGGVEVTVQLKDDSTLVAADKFLVSGPELADTSNPLGVYISQTRFPLSKGNYNMLIDLKDINDPSEVYHLEQNIDMKLGGESLQTSDLIMLDSYTPSSDENIFSKSGYDLVPMVSSGSHYFTEGVDDLSFYMEIYNTDKALGKDEPYVVKYFLKNADNNQVLNDYASFSRKKATPVQPVLATFNIADLPTGNFELGVEALDKKGNPVISKNMSFYRKNSVAPISFDNIEDVDYQGTFADRITSIDSLHQYTKYLWPISSEAERRYQKELLAGNNLSKLKRYFFVFWSQRNKLDPESAWISYLEDVKTVNQLYSSRLRKGYMTDRGRVFLVYGKPTTIDQRKFEPSLPPYEMWQYNSISSPYVVNQTNKYFVFAEFDRSTNDYQLIHSTAIGEINNRRWRYHLSRGATGTGGDIDQNTLNTGDDWGSRANDNIIIQGSQFDNR